MLVLFIVSVTFVLLVWAMCSLAEASLYAVRKPYIRQLVQDDHRAGRILADFKENMEQPISAILIVNTVVAAAGASVAGAQASKLFGEENLIWFSATFTIAALLLSEIIPKVIGVAYSQSLSCLVAKPVLVVVTCLYPLIWIIERLSKLMTHRAPRAVAPEEEVQQMAEISAEEGSIMSYEADLVRHVLALDRVTAGEIMTPVSVVVKLPNDLTLSAVHERIAEWNFSRIPLHDPGNDRKWTGFVLTRDILSALALDEFDRSLQTLAKPLHFVRDTAPGHKLLQAFLTKRTHMFGVVTDNAAVVGVVTLEDVLESMIGAEIVDELDLVVDMQQLAETQPNVTR